MTKSNIKNVESFVDETIQNIRDDRALAMSLLADLMKYLKKDDGHHRDSGPVAAKYLETLQRSNEQLVKITTLISKRTSSAIDLSDADRGEIYDFLNKE